MKQTNARPKSFDDLPLGMSVPDVAAVLGVSRSHAYALVHSEDFPRLMVGNRLVVPKDAFRVWMEKSAGGASA